MASKKTHARDRFIDQGLFRCFSIKHYSHSKHCGKQLQCVQKPSHGKRLALVVKKLPLRTKQWYNSLVQCLDSWQTQSPQKPHQAFSFKFLQWIQLSSGGNQPSLTFIFGQASTTAESSNPASRLYYVVLSVKLSPWLSFGVLPLDSQKKKKS